MTRLAHVIERFSGDLIARYATRLQPEHLQALAALRRCRTPQSQMMQWQCAACPNQRFIPHSCGYRNFKRYFSRILNVSDDRQAVKGARNL